MREYRQSETETKLGVEPLGSYDVVIPHGHVEATDELRRVDDIIERTVASVHGVLTADIIERRSELRRLLGISDD